MPIARGCSLAYETFHNLPLGTSTVAQLERPSTGIVAWAEYATVIESYNAQKVKDHCQKLLKDTGVVDIVEARCKF